MTDGFFEYSDERIASAFKRDDVRGVYGPEFNVFVAEELGAAYAGLLHREFAAECPCVAVGRDARQGSIDLALAFCRGVEREGGRCVRLGLASSEICYHAAASVPFLHGAAMITASHNPAEFNGAKMVKRGAIPLTTDELAELRREILARPRPRLPETLDLGADFARTLLGLSGLSATADFGLKEPLRVFVEAGNGVGAVAFAPIAAELEASGQFAFEWGNREPNGGFPNGVPNPLLPAYAAQLGQDVRANGADLGVGFDGDADRAGFVDERGESITCSQVLGLLAPRLVAASGKHDPVVMGNLCCSQLLRDLFPCGGPVEWVDTPVGHAKIKELMRSDEYRTRVVFAGEHSGHYFYPQFHYVDSGNLTTLLMLRLAAETKASGGALSGLLDVWRARYCWSDEINYAFPNLGMAADAVDAIYGKYGAGTERYGVAIERDTGLWRVRRAEAGETYSARAAFPQDLKLRFPADRAETSGWWLVVRLSGNEAKLRLNVESWGEGAPAVMKTKRDALEALLLELGAERLPD